MNATDHRTFHAPTIHRIDGQGEFSTVFNGRFWETVFFLTDRQGHSRNIHDVHGEEQAGEFAAKLNAMSPGAREIVLDAYALVRDD